MSGGAGGRKRRGQEEEHENHERWLVTYADMLTVLMALFIVMFALSVVDKAKFEKFKEGLNGDLGNGASLLSGGPGLQQAGDTPIDLQSAITALDEKQSRQQAAAHEKDELERARQKILQALVAKGMQDEVRFKLDERGLVVTVVTDDVLFALGSAELRPKGSAVLDAIAPALKALPNQVTVEGHTDDLPISGRYASNWELSTERATSVLRYLLDTHRVPAQRLSAAGYADQRALTPNISAAARSANRRVEVIVRATPLEQLPVATAPRPIPNAIPPITAVPNPVPALRSSTPAAPTRAEKTDTHADAPAGADPHATTDEEH
jgi:chemotaxis protein MotB